MDIQPMDIAINIINIVVLYVLLRFILYKPVKKFMQARTAGIQKNISDAESAKADALALKGSYDERLKDAKGEAEMLIKEGNEKANQSATSIVEAAHQQAEELLKKAEEKASREREDMVQALEKQITDMAIALAGEILQREIRQEDNEKLIDNFFHKAG